MPRRRPPPPPKKKPRRIPPPGPPPPPPDPVVVGEATPVTAVVGPPAPAAPTSWLDWYNNKATLDEQQRFDRAASVIDNGGPAYRRNGSQQAYVENFAGSSLYLPLINYRDTGGRRAMFTVPPKDYGPRPISIAQKGGPIERVAPTMLALHPGKYSYTDVTKNGPAFRQWLEVVKEAVTVGQTQVSPSVLPFGDPYYVDYELTITKDTAWPESVGPNQLQGAPTWLPEKINIVDYWGQVTSSHPDWDWPGRQLAKAGDALKGVGTLAAFVAFAYLAYTLKPNPSPSTK